MHDDLEGFSHLVVCLVLLNAMEKNHISMEFINEQFSKIYDVSLPKLSKYNIKNFHLPCTASQMIVILQYFGLLFGDLFDYDDDIWILFCNHKLFLNIILSPYYDKDVDIDYFKFLVAAQLETIYKYTDFNPKYKCKLHYICHYPELYHYFSGLRYLWCMRSEAQHQVIKNISRQCKNYNNVAFTCAKNFQIQKALVVTHFMPHDLKEAKCSSIIKISSILTTPEKIKLSNILNVKFDSLGQICFSTTVLNFRGFHYKTPTLNKRYCLAIFKDSYIDLIMISCIIKVTNKWVLICKKIKATFSTHYNCYLCTILNDDTIFCMLSQHIVHQQVPLMLYRGQLYASLKYHPYVDMLNEKSV
ncbi:hypothetical protein BOX15_Mlig020007g3 [Macrostomum lignano]|uniref:Uncharacterized protein n=1 Tax=Macrostomum lignano TaxID=282301 RepID=A0A267G717_9PLAT|nr:hypothetical protein BOX15_Mlig020007g3 [Macrostomum lignano]